ncbi:hypothetical protein MTR67_048029 [Solanum verrucosum]|uniref:Uncharacterized protein n=1 Tax=Solanum verrucosum TaxID=315347 RepID=A0AAF0V035_SOLVR|nr:hypothetical protein MTR67_048029 [Solanum verrucosum]
MARIPNSVANSLEINLSLLLDHQTLMKITCPSWLSKMRNVLVGMLDHVGNLVCRDVSAYARSRVFQKISTEFTYYDVVVVTTSAENINALNRVLVHLCTRGNPKDGATLTLRRLVDEEACDLSGENFARFMDHLYERITTLLDSNEVSENLGALRAIDELIDVIISENASKVAKFSNYTLIALKQSVILKS